LIVSARFLLVANFAASGSGVVSWLPDAAHVATALQAITLPLGAWVTAGLAAAAGLVECEASVGCLVCDADPQAPSMSEIPTANIADITADFPRSFIPAAPLWLNLWLAGLMW
jgi:hypothetical protein